MNNEILFRLFSSGLNLHQSLCVGCLLQAGAQVLLYPRNFWEGSLRKNIFTPIGVHPFEKIGFKVEK